MVFFCIHADKLPCLHTLLSPLSSPAGLIIRCCTGRQLRAASCDDTGARRSSRSVKRKRWDAALVGGGAEDEAADDSEQEEVCPFCFAATYGSLGRLMLIAVHRMYAEHVLGVSAVKMSPSNELSAVSMQAVGQQRPYMAMAAMFMLS